MTNPPPQKKGELFAPPSASIRKDTKHYLIYFLTGNPGYIRYYETFLTSLSSLISPLAEKNAAFTIYGKSLLGFEDTPKHRVHGPYTFNEIIADSRISLLSLKIAEGERKGQYFDGVIFMGHSVGSYMAMDILSQLHHSDNPLNKNLIGAILLFPTVTHIAKSSSGQKFSTLFSIPKFPTLVHYLSRAFWPLSDSALEWAVQRVTGMPADAARTTTEFLKSSTGVRQSLSMARDEMETITEDKWDTEIWGATEADENGEDKDGSKGKNKERNTERNKERNKEGDTATVLYADQEASARTEKCRQDYGLKLRFLFGTDDHWVADHTRDELIKARGSGRHANVKMVVEETGIPHGFCIRHSEQVAEKIAPWIKEMVDL